MIPELDRLFNPSSLAVIGASKDENKSGGFFLKNIIDRGFKGKLYPVNPRESEIMGLKNYASVLDIPGEIDLAMLTVPAGTVPRVMAECARKGVRFAVVHSVGFSELGAEGKALEKEMLDSARQGNTRIIGPNCMGLYSPRAHINTIVTEGIPEDEPGAVTFIGQSGWVAENFIQIGYERGLRFNQVLSIGNQSDLTFEDLLEYFDGDTNTGVIALYIEGIKREKEFLRLASRISKKKPVIVWKAGRTETGIGAAALHTNATPTNYAALEAALKRSGVAIARNMEELIDLSVGFTCPALPRGDRLSLLVDSGAAGVAGADSADLLGLKVSKLSAKAQEELRELLEGKIPPFPTPGNPVDLVWPPNDGNLVQMLRRCSQIMLTESDMLVMVTYAEFDELFVRELGSLRDETGKPIFVVPGHPVERSTAMSLLSKNGIPSFSIPERAVSTLAAMLHHSNYRQQS